MSRSLFIRLVVLAFFIGLNLVLGSYFLTQARVQVPRPVVEFMMRFGLIPGVDSVLNQLTISNSLEPLLEEQAIILRINQERIAAGLGELEEQPQLATISSRLWEALAASGYDLDSKALDGVLERSIKEVNYRYEWVSHHAMVGPLSTESVIAAWLGAEDPGAGILNPEFSQIGLTAQIIDDRQLGRVGVVVLVLGKPQQAGGRRTQATLPGTVQQQPAVREIPDSEVMEALNTYRQTHGRPLYQVSDQLCQYAEKRVQDLISFGGLDAHAGFKQDFEDKENPPVGIRDYSGRTIGENLAQQYCRNMQTGESFVANTGTSLIEWCFDSSTLGHREAQLSTQFKNFCVRHGRNMYVVIFGD
jgi:uncharacterized protein YkwD